MSLFAEPLVGERGRFDGNIVMSLMGLGIGIAAMISFAACVPPFPADFEDVTHQLDVNVPFPGDVDGVSSVDGSGSADGSSGTEGPGSIEDTTATDEPSSLTDTVTNPDGSLAAEDLPVVGEETSTLTGDTVSEQPDSTALQDAGPGDSTVLPDTLSDMDLTLPDTPEGECPNDEDCDGVNDFWDEAPEDPVWPGKTESGIIYINTSSSLYSLDIADNPPKLVKIGDFVWPDTYGANQMIDIAIDGDNLLYGLGFDRVYRCSAVNAACRSLKGMSYTDQYNGLTMIPKGTLADTPNQDVLIATKRNGDWMRVYVTGATANLVKLGNFNDTIAGNYNSAGDAYSIYQGKTLASVIKGDAKNYLVEVDPATGAVNHELGVLTPYTKVWGLSGNLAGSRVFGFDESGCILEISPPTETMPLMIDEITCRPDLAWWGAAVTTFSGKPY